MPDPLKVAVQVDGKGDLDALKQSAKNVEVEIKNLNLMFGLGAHTTAEYGTKLAQLRGNLNEIRSQIKQAEAASKSFGAGGASGLLQMSYALDDIQYGFRAIVNNIPQLGQGLGAAMGLSPEKAMAFAGALGIVAVTVNQIMQHWEEIDRAFGNTAPVEALKGAWIQLKEAFESSNKEQDKGFKLIHAIVPEIFLLKDTIKPYVDSWKNATKAAEEHEKIVQKIAEATKTIEGIKGEAASARGSKLQQAIAAAGGGDAVIKQMTEEAARKGGITDPEMRKALADQIRLTIQSGLAGEDISKALPENVLAEMRHLDRQEEVKSDRKARSEMEKVQATDAQKARDAILDRLRAGKDARLRGMEDERDELAKKRREIADRIRDAPRQITGDSVFTYLDRIQKAAGGDVRKDELATLKAIDKKMADLTDAMKKERRTVFAP